MHPELKIWLKDIDLSISEIHDFFTVTKGFSAFQKDLKARKAIECNIEIVGEAMKRIIDIEPGILISDSRKIVDTRNRIIHGYDNISADVIWLIVTHYLRCLKKK